MDVVLLKSVEFKLLAIRKTCFCQTSFKFGEKILVKLESSLVKFGKNTAWFVV